MAIAATPAAAPPTAAYLPASVAASNAAPHGWTTHRVRSGDTLIGIAARYRSTVDVIAMRNNIRNRSHIVVGTTLSVPRTSAAATKTTTGTSTPAASSRVHVVRSGDTLIGIAATYHVSLASVLKANHLSMRSTIYVGQKVTVRGAATTTSAAKASTRKPATAAKPSATSYRVRAGDTLGAIARAHGTTVSAITKANGISSRSLIHPGQTLSLPGAKKPAAAAKKTSAVPDTYLGVTYPKKVAEAAAHNRAVLAKRTTPSRSATKDLIIATARRHGVDPKLALAIAWQESGWNQRAVSPANAVGVMQVIPAGGQWASDLTGRTLDLLDTEDNITAGVVMLRALGRSTSSTENAVAAYYQGLTSLRERGMYTDTGRYVDTVMALRKTM
ncbi:MAG: LysM peptidoglycan-binding domain-containing protein [Ornithinibacter sp.]